MSDVTQITETAFSTVIEQADATPVDLCARVGSCGLLVCQGDDVVWVWNEKLDELIAAIQRYKKERGL